MAEPGVMVITGSRSGIGKALARHYCQLGYQVVGCSRQKSDLDIPNYHHHQLDVADEAAVSALFSWIRKTLGRLDVLINNAGQIAVNNILLTPLSQAQEVMRTNFIGTFLCCREAVKVMMKTRRGRIINLTSIAVPLAQPGTGIYSSSKAAVEQFTKVLAAEVEPMGIKVNALGLSMVAQSGMALAMSSQAAQAAVDLTKLKRWLSMDEVCKAMDEMLDEKNSATGKTIYLGEVETK